MPKMSIQPTVSLSRYSHTSTAQFCTSRPTATGRSTSSYTKAEVLVDHEATCSAQGGPRGGGPPPAGARVAVVAGRAASCCVLPTPSPPAAGRGERNKRPREPARPFPCSSFSRVPPPANCVGPEEWGYMSVSGWPRVWAVERGPRTASAPPRSGRGNIM